MSYVVTGSVTAGGCGGVGAGAGGTTVVSVRDGVRGEMVMAFTRGAFLKIQSDREEWEKVF